MRVRLIAVLVSLAVVAFASMPAPARAASLAEEVALLMETHPRIKSARNNVSAAEEGINRAFGEYLPRLDLLTDYGFEHTSSPGLRATRFGQALNTPRESFSVTLTENLFNGFLRESNNEAARLNKAVADIGLESVRQEVLFEAVAAYLNVLRHAKLIEFAVLNERTIQRQLNLEDERVQRGGGIAVDVLQSKSRLQIAKERRVAFEGNLRNAMARYVQVFNTQPEVGGMTIPGLPLDLVPATLEDAEKAALAENPRLAISGRAVDLASELKRAAKSPYYPEIDVIAEYNYEQDVQGVIGTRRDYVIKLEARWELFNGFQTRADAAGRAYQHLAALDEHAFRNRKVIEDVRLSWDQLDTVRQRVSLLQNAINIAVEVHEARIKRREAGQETLLDVLDAENEVFNAQIGAADAEFDERIALYRLLFAMGRMSPETLLQSAAIEPGQSVAEWATGE